MHAAFADHFAPVANAYADFRPTYPAGLFDWLARLAPGRELSWDCACGSGQASVDLAGHFERVVATDASAAQLTGAPPHPRVEYRQAPAEASGLPPASVDLIAVAQALHWFDLDRFYGEARRVLRPAGVLAVWSYGIQAVEGEAVNAAVRHFYHQVVGPYWPAERVHVETGYHELAFPFPERAAPEFVMTARWSLPRLLGYFASWSATGRFIAARGADPAAALGIELAPLWGRPEQERRITWPLALRVGVHSG